MMVLQRYIKILNGIVRSATISLTNKKKKLTL